MPITLTPLRYPGGKTKLFNKIVDIIEFNKLDNITYAEPFAGGAGLAIKLLLNNKVRNIIINDIDPAIYAFWFSSLYFTDELCSRINNINITLNEREKQIYILKNQSLFSMLDIGFATLFLNRTNVSGILSAGPIGGKEQKGKDKLNARFIKSVIINKISSIADNKDRISIHHLDVIDFIYSVLPQYDQQDLFINFDPPYVVKGQELYLNHFTLLDHERLYNSIVNSPYNWIMTYDYNDFILNLYSSFHYEQIHLNHSAGNMKLGKELLIYSDNLQQPTLSM